MRRSIDEIASQIAEKPDEIRSKWIASLAYELIDSQRKILETAEMDEVQRIQGSISGIRLLLRYIPHERP